MALSREESHYVARVCRATVGDQTSATDGRGQVAQIEIESIGAHGVTVRCLASTHQDRGAVSWVLCGAPEHDRGDWLVEKLAELGVARFQPVQTTRGRWPEGRQERWRRLSLAGLRQSRQAHLMEVGEPVSLDEAIAGIPERSTRWVARPVAEPALAPTPFPAHAIGLVGPSGGWTDAESQDLERAGFQSMSLARARLRTETAALAWAAWWAGLVVR
jgi:16S rRNA (uracil1498-N3)-methyltransferase